MSRRLIIDIIASLFILLFFYTAINKLMEIEALKSVLVHYPLLEYFPGFAAWVVPIAELSVVTLLFFPATRLMGLYASLALMVTFTIYLVYMLSSTTKLPCTCGGMLQALSWPQHIVFNILFILLATVAIVLRKTQRSNTGVPPGFIQAHS